MNPDYMFGFFIGMILFGWMFTKLGIWFCKKYYSDPIDAIYQSVLITSAVTMVFGSFNFGLFASFLIYVPSLFAWHYVALRKLQRNLSS